MTRLIVVDDETDLLYAVETVLKRAGYEVTAVTSAAAALSALKATGAQLVLCDVMMPVMSGHELLESVRADAAIKDTPMLMMSAAPFEPGEHAPVAGFLKKPFDIGQLLGAVKRIAPL